MADFWTLGKHLKQNKVPQSKMSSRGNVSYDPLNIANEFNILGNLVLE